MDVNGISFVVLKYCCVYFEDSHWDFLPWKELCVLSLYLIKRVNVGGLNRIVAINSILILLHAKQINP